jgi:hypothetical protein
LEAVRRLYLLDDWRQRDLDVLVRLPFLVGPGREVLTGGPVLGSTIGAFSIALAPRTVPASFHQGKRLSLTFFIGRSPNRLREAKPGLRKPFGERHRLAVGYFSRLEKGHPRKTSPVSLPSVAPKLIVKK